MLYTTQTLPHYVYLHICVLLPYITILNPLIGLSVRSASSFRAAVAQWLRYPTMTARRVARQLGCSDCVVRRCWTSGSERCHLHEDQAQDATDRSVVEKNATS
ncbi:hypothetical protein TNCV_2437491 [Trichonephila clavipes]|nr:hypothetical protein TNCV_2437491 [Trichonephila clavipes]